MDGMNPKKLVFVIGATNRPDIIDPALMRPGRLDNLIYIPLPDSKSRTSILKAALHKTPIAHDVDVALIAGWVTEGFSGADVTELCQRACKCAISEIIEWKNIGAKQMTLLQNSIDTYNVKRMHFEKSLLSARRSVSDACIGYYRTFAKTTQQNHTNQSTNHSVYNRANLYDIKQSRNEVLGNTTTSINSDIDDLY